MTQDVYIVDGARTPFIKSNNTPGSFSAADLATSAGRDLLLRNNLAPTCLDELILGCVMPSPSEANIARVVSLRLGCGKLVPAYTVQRNCASGMQALDSAAKDIQLGRHNLVLAGGTEAMSRAPLLFNASMVAWMSALFKTKTLSQKLKQLIKFRLPMLKPEIALLKGLTDPSTKLSMGHTAEELAYRFDISRNEMDTYALESHARAARAWSDGDMCFVTDLYAKAGEVCQKDNGIRVDGSIDKLAKLKPFFDKKFGAVTAGNSSQISDGAALLLLASKKAVEQFNLPVIGKIVATEWSGVAPEVMGLGPVHAIAQLLQKQALSLSDIDFWEINEAFAAQVTACVKALNSQSYCQNKLGLQEVLGEIPMGSLNVDGGAIAVGHPVGASGARIVLHLLQVLERNQSRRGIASLCIGGGQGGAMLIERGDA